jgi:hypothetical protein
MGGKVAIHPFLTPSARDAAATFRRAMAGSSSRDIGCPSAAAIRRILQCKRVVGLLQNVADRLQLSLPAS